MIHQLPAVVVHQAELFEDVGRMLRHVRTHGLVIFGLRGDRQRKIAGNG